MKRLSPQELINMPGAGRAEKHLRETGRWRLTASDMLNQIHDDWCSSKANDIINDVIDVLENEEPK